MATKLLLINYNQNIHKHLNWLPGNRTIFKIATKSKNAIKPEVATRITGYTLIKTFTNTTTGYLDKRLPGYLKIKKK